MFETLNFKALLELNNSLPSITILGDITHRVEDDNLIIDFLFNIQGSIYRDTLVYTSMPNHFTVEKDILKSLIFFMAEI